LNRQISLLKSESEETRSVSALIEVELIQFSGLRTDFLNEKNNSIVSPLADANFPRVEFET